MSLPRMYTEFAHYCQLMNPVEDYADEAPQWTAVLRRHLGPGRHEILELGTGGGNQLWYWTKEFKVTAADLSPSMIEQARKLCPDVEFHVGDMRTMRLGRRFNAVLISDAIDYLTSEEDLRATFATAAAHLEPGGALIACPDFYRETFSGPIDSSGTNSVGRVHFTQMQYIHDPNPSDTTIEVLSWYLLNEAGQLRIEQDHHVYGLFPMQTWLDLMNQAGFTVEKVPFRTSEAKMTYLLVGVLRCA